MGLNGSLRRPAGVAVALALMAAVASPARAATSSPNDPAFTRGDQWALTGAPGSINAPAAWCVSVGAGVLIADIDTGADFSHPDLAGKLVRGARFTAGDGSAVAGDVNDDNGHGTSTAGIMVAATNNGTGIAAVAPAARALVVKVLDASGSGSGADIAAGIHYAVDYRGAGGERVRVLNLSLGTDTPALVSGLLGGTDIQDALRYAVQHDVAVAAAAGNSGNGLLSANDYGQLAGIALVAGAVGREGAPAPYSTAGNIYAPGGDSSGGQDIQHEVVSTSPGGYKFHEGTSFAAPHVAGVLAQLISAGYAPAAARQRILATAINHAGVPEVDAGRALGAQGSCATATAAGVQGATGGPSPVRTSAAVRHPVRPAIARPAATAVPTAVPTAPPAAVPAATPPPPLEPAIRPPRTAGTRPLGLASNTGSSRLGLVLGGGGASLVVAAALAYLGRRRLGGLIGRR